jgi:Sec-independent protein secretion pathway component TatC
LRFNLPQPGVSIIRAAPQAQLKTKENWTEAQRPRAIAITTVLFILTLIFAGPVLLIRLLVALPIIGLSGLSLLVSRNRYRKWVDEMIAKYAKYVASQSDGVA